MVRYSIRDERQDLILSSALNLITTGGIDSLTMTEIAQHTGLSRPAIYQYFNSREHILCELVINEMADLSNFIDQEIGACAEPLSCINQWIALMVDYLASPAHREILSVSVTTFPEESRGMIRALHSQFMTSLLDPLTALNVDDALAQGRMIYALVVDAASQISEGADRDHVIAQLQSFVSSALVA